MYKRVLLPDEISLLAIEVKGVMMAFEKAGKQIYLVGGGVRAILRGQVPHDCDFTTNATPEEILKICEKWEPFYDNAYGTVGMPIERERKEIYEITPFRTEKGYSDRRRPDVVEWGSSLEEDVKRREFTMNAIVIGREGKDYVVIDYFEGIEDFGKGIIRAVGDAKERFAEDALRMMRAVRFGAQMGLAIEEKTFLGLSENAPLLSQISKERIRDELLKIMGRDKAAEGVDVLVKTGMMKEIMPEVLETIGVWQTGHHSLDVYSHMLEALRNCPSSNPIVRLATFLHDVGKPRTKRLRCIKCGLIMKEGDKLQAGESAKLTQFKCPKCGTLQSEHEAGTFYGHEVVGARMAEEICERLRLPKKDKEKIVTLIRWHMFSYDSKMTDASIRRFIRRIGKENINDMMVLRIGDRKGGGSKTTSWRLMELQKRIGEQLFEPMEINDMAVNGKDVMEKLKIEPGRKVGEVLKALFEEVLEDTSKNTKEYLLKRVEELGN